MKQKAHIFQVFAVLCAVTVFALCVFYAAALGAGIYRDISETLDEAYAVHTGVDYIAAKIRGSDKSGGAEIGELDGVTALILAEELDGEEYVNYIYCYEGSLYELFCARDAELSPADGMPLLDIERLEVEELSRGLYRLACSSKGARAEVCVALGSTGGEGR